MANFFSLDGAGGYNFPLNLPGKSYYNIETNKTKRTKTEQVLSSFAINIFKLQPGRGSFAFVFRILNWNDWMRKELEPFLITLVCLLSRLCSFPIPPLPSPVKSHPVSFLHSQLILCSCLLQYQWPNSLCLLSQWAMPVIKWKNVLLMIVCVTGIMFRLMTTWILSSKAASLVDRALELGGVVSGYQKDDLSTNLSCQAFSSQL